MKNKKFFSGVAVAALLFSGSSYGMFEVYDSNPQERAKAELKVKIFHQIDSTGTADINSIAASADALKAKALNFDVNELVLLCGHTYLEHENANAYHGTKINAITDINSHRAAVAAAAAAAKTVLREFAAGKLTQTIWANTLVAIVGLCDLQDAAAAHPGVAGYDNNTAITSALAANNIDVLDPTTFLPPAKKGDPLVAGHVALGQTHKRRAITLTAKEIDLDNNGTAFHIANGDPARWNRRLSLVRLIWETMADPKQAPAALAYINGHADDADDRISNEEAVDAIMTLLQ